MKITLILLSCLVAISYQQRFLLNSQFAPRIGYLPYFYGVLPNGQHFLFDAETEPNQAAEEQVESDSLARSKFPQPQNRFLFANPFSIFSLFTSTSTTTATVVATATAWTTVNSTITTTSIQLCVSTDQFTVLNPLPATPLYSTICARRRREVALIEDLKESIRASEVKEVETSALPELPQERHVVDEPLLVSSKDDQVDESFTPLRRTGRAATVLSTSTVTVTSTSTSYQFVPTAFQKPITLVGAASLKCMPPGLVTCK